MRKAIVFFNNTVKRLFFSLCPLVLTSSPGFLSLCMRAKARVHAHAMDSRPMDVMHVHIRDTQSRKRNREERGERFFFFLSF